MQNARKVFVMLAVLLLTLGVLPTYAVATHWSQQLQLSPGVSPDGPTAQGPSVAVEDADVYVVWSQFDGNSDIYFKRNNARGNPPGWQVECRIYATPGLSQEPDIATWGKNLYAVWADGSPGNFHIYISRALAPDFCIWATPTDLTSGSLVDNVRPRVAVDAQYAHVVWEGGPLGDRRTYYTRWDGAVQGSTFQLSSCASESPDVTVAEGAVVAVWRGKSAPPLWHIFYSRSTDGGTSWPGTPHCSVTERLSGTFADSKQPTVDAFEKYVHTAWVDTSFSPNQVYYRRSVDAAASWDPINFVSYSATDVKNPRIAACGLCVGIVWNALWTVGGDNDDLFFQHSTDNGVSWLPADRRITSGSAHDQIPAIAADKRLDGWNLLHGDYHVAFEKLQSIPKIWYIRRSSDEIASVAKQRDPLDPGLWGTSAAYRGSGSTAYVFGGWKPGDSGWIPVPDILSFDVVNPSFTDTTKDLPYPGWAQTSAVADPTTGRYFIFGGRAGGSVSLSIVKYEPPGDPIVVNNFPTSRFGTSAVVDGDPSNPSAYIFGGETSLGAYLDEIWRYDLVANTREFCGSLPSARAHTAAVWDPAGRAFIFGGRVAGVPDGTDQILSFTPGASPNPKCPGIVVQVGSLPPTVEEQAGPRYGMSAVWDSARNKAYLFGGLCCGDDFTFDAVLTYDPAASPSPTTTVNCVPLPTKRAYTSAIWKPVAPDKAYVFFGGYDPDVSMRQVIEYHPYTI